MFKLLDFQFFILCKYIMTIITKVNDTYVSNNCKVINIVWTDRGILVSIIYYIIRLYDTLIDKYIIIDLKRYRQVLKRLFFDLKFKKYKKHNSKNFYFNIRKIIKKQDIIIDYLHNYNIKIPTKKFRYIPWYDLNDPLIIFKYSKKYYSKKNSFYVPICMRGNYYGHVWDAYVEYNILIRYKIIIPDMNIREIIRLINRYLIKYFTDTVVYKYVFNKPIFYVNKQVNNMDNNIDELIILITEKVSEVNDLLYEKIK